MSAKTFRAGVASAVLVIAMAVSGTTTAQALEQCTPGTTPTPVPAPEQPSAPASGSLTGGKGGTASDRLSVRLTAAGRTSTYHVFASHVDLSKPVKLQIHLHGDGGYEAKNPGYSINTAYRNVAKANNAVLIVPATPNADTTWWTDRTASDWLAELVKLQYSQFNIDKSDVWFSGYSGGAQALSQHFIPKHHGLIDGGGVVLVGGGGVYTNNLGPAAARLGSSLEVRYIAGSRDTGPGFNALAAAQNGAPKWRSAGFKNVTLDVINGDTHNMIANNGPTTLAQYR